MVLDPRKPEFISWLTREDPKPARTRPGTPLHRYYDGVWQRVDEPKQARIVGQERAYQAAAAVPPAAVLAPAPERMLNSLVGHQKTLPTRAQRPGREQAAESNRRS